MKNTRLSERKPLILFRGMKKDLKSEYKCMTQMFWPAFTSTSEKLAQAELYTDEANKSGTIFEIQISKNSPHPHMKLPFNWTRWKESEVLLWPNFAFHCLKIRKEKWYSYVVLKQDETFIMISADYKNLKIWWVDLFTKKLKFPLLVFFSRVRHRIRFGIDFRRFFINDENIYIKIANFNSKEKNLGERVERLTKEFMLNIKNIIFDKECIQQTQKDLYQIIIKNMDVLETIERIAAPFLMEIVKSIDGKWRKEVLEIFAENDEFFKIFDEKIMRFVTERLGLYEKECFHLCQNYFEEK